MQTIAILCLIGSAVSGRATPAIAETELTIGPLLDPSARLLENDEASEYWTLFIELESGHRITQRFLLTNVGPGEHTAVAVGHLVEAGRPPFLYVNGRRRARWTLSDDKLFLDIGASHLDLHRPHGQLLITKDDIEIRLFFDFGKSDLAAAVPRDRLPTGYAVDFLAIGAKTRGSIQAPWMTKPIETTGRTWLAHTWTVRDEASLIDRRVDVFAGAGEAALYGLQLQKDGRRVGDWYTGRDSGSGIIESTINVPESWVEIPRTLGTQGSSSYPLPGDFEVSGRRTGRISLGKEWLRFDPLIVIPNPFRWFIRRVTQPQEVWAEAQIDVTLWAASESPSLLNTPDASESKIEPSSTANEARSNSAESRSPADSKRETEKGSAVSSVTGVASITFMNPVEHRSSD